MFEMTLGSMSSWWKCWHGGNTKIGLEDGGIWGFLGNVDECGLPNDSTLLDREASSSVILVRIKENITC